MQYKIIFPIWKCPQWTAFRGSVNHTGEQVVIARWTQREHLEEEIEFLKRSQRVKPLIESQPLTAAQRLLPSVLILERQPTYTDLVLDNCQEWQILSGDLTTLLQIYYGYSQFEGMRTRDCTLENIISYKGSIVILDFGIRRLIEKYCVYWNPLILKNLPYESSYQWSLGVMYLILTQGKSMLSQINRMVQAWHNGMGSLSIQSLCTSKNSNIQSLIQQLMNPVNPIKWEQIPQHAAFQENLQCRLLIKKFTTRVKRSSTRNSTHRSTSPSTPFLRKNSQESLNSSVINKLSLNLTKTALIAHTSSQPQIQRISQQPKTSPLRINSFRTVSQVIHQKNAESNTSDDFSPNTIENRKISLSPQTERCIKSTDLIQRARVSSQKLIKSASQQSSFKNIYQKVYYRKDQKKQSINQRIQSQLKSEAPSVDQTCKYIQLIRKDQFDDPAFYHQYTEALELINLFGDCTAKCLECFNGLNNFWVIPLFLLFKRMYQMRMEFEDLIIQKKNIYQLDQWDSVTQSNYYAKMIRAIRKDNEMILNELRLLLDQALNKVMQLEPIRRKKCMWFLNDDFQQDIKDVCLSYLTGQIFKGIQSSSEIFKNQFDWMKLQFQLFVCIQIYVLPVGQYDQFDYTWYKQISDSNDLGKMASYLDQ